MAMATVILWSCQEKEDLNVAASGKVELTGDVSEGQIVVGPDGGEFQVNVTSSENWRVSGISDWVSLSSESGKSGQPLTFKVDPYSGDKSRTVTFKVFAASAVESVSITQTPAYSISLVSDEVVDVNADVNQVAVSMISNVENLEVDFGGAEEWISLNGVSDAFGKKIALFDIRRSQEFKGRSAVLTLGGPGVDEPVSITVNQAQRDTAFVVGEQRIVKGLEALSVDVVIKSNVDVTYSLPSWLTRKINSTTEKDDTGLKSQSVTLTAAACAGSRSATISFRGTSSTVGSFFIKQQNPNPIFLNIPDENLRYLLQSQGMIIDEGEQCELIESGLNATSLTIGEPNANYYYGADPIKSIEGLESFPKLEKLTLGNIMVEKVDVSAFPKLTELALVNLCEVSEVNTGSRPIIDVTNVSGTYTYTNVPQIVIKGDYIESINFSVNGYYIGYEYTFESFDVTGCPKLKVLNINRTGYWEGDQSSLKYIYMTQTQKETVYVIKQNTVEIVVK